MPIRVRDIMASPVVTVRETATVREVVRTLIDNGLSGVPVLGADGAMVGVVSEHDLLGRAEFGAGHPTRRIGRWPRSSRSKPQATTARGLMSRPVVTVDPDETVAAAAHTMSLARVKRLPVVDTSGELLGIVGRRDLLRVFLRPDNEIRQSVRDEVFANLLIDPGTVRVEVADGRVTMYGRLERRTLAELAERLVQGVEGVVTVDNRLTWAFDDIEPGPPADTAELRMHGLGSSPRSPDRASTRRRKG